MPSNMSKESLYKEENATSEDGLLENQDDLDLVELENAPRLKQKSWKRLGSFRFLVFTHVVALVLYTAIFFTASRHYLQKLEHSPDLIYSPAREAVRYEKKFLHNDVYDQNPFKGNPSPELDAAWHDLFRWNNIRLTKAELDRMNRTSVQLADGSGDYAASLDIYHHLHCVKYIRHFIHPEYYTMELHDVTPEEHVDHCLDAIRQELMCRAEVTMTTYDWDPKKIFPQPHLAYEHECVNFEALDDWAKSRSFDIKDPKFFVHPTLGRVFPENSMEKTDGMGSAKGIEA